MQVQNIEGHSLQEVAAMLDRSPSAVRRWIRSGWVTCGTKVRVNNTDVYVFSDDDVAQLRVMLAGIKSGPRTNPPS